MALIKCKECGAEVSSTAKTCQKCGAKVKVPVGVGKAVAIVAVFGAIIAAGQFQGRQSEKSEAPVASAPVPIPVKHCSVMVKFDDAKPVAMLGGGLPADGRANVWRLTVTPKFMASLRKSNTLIVEADFYKSPAVQMEFSTAGLKW